MIQLLASNHLEVFECEQDAVNAAMRLVSPQFGLVSLDRTVDGGNPSLDFDVRHFAWRPEGLADTGWQKWRNGKRVR